MASAVGISRELTDVCCLPNCRFAVTAEASWNFIRSNGLEDQIENPLRNLDTADIDHLQRRGKRIRHVIMEAVLPEAICWQIVMAYRQLGDREDDPIDVAVRSSADAEDPTDIH